MRVSRFLRILRWFLVPFAAFVICAPEAFAQDSVGRFQGRVFLEGTREGVAGATVRAEPPRFQPNGDPETIAVPVETVTDDNGRFALTWLRSGIWRVTASLEGLEDALVRIEVTQGETFKCTARQIQHCKEKIEVFMSKPRSAVERVLEGVADGLDTAQIKADLIAADEAYNRGEYQAAIDGYNGLLAIAPTLTALHLQIGTAHRALEEYEEALASYDRLLAADPDHPGVKDEIARTRLYMGDLGAADDLTAAAGGSGSREDLYTLGELEFSKGDAAAAAGWYEKAVAADPSWEKPVFKLGLVALNQGDIEGAKAQFQKVIDLAPNSEDGAQAKATLAALP